MPDTPISDSAARTSSSLKGLIMAVINFIRGLREHWVFGPILLLFEAGGTPILGAARGLEFDPMRLTGPVATGYRGYYDFDDSHHRRRPSGRPGGRYPAPRGL